MQNVFVLVLVCLCILVLGILVKVLLRVLNLHSNKVKQIKDPLHTLFETFSY